MTLIRALFLASVAVLAIVAGRLIFP